uniref:LRRNT domain-containing protein n=1 Tax=Mastacembelus armatus TaxID=205130 RepID=A0A3Q3N0A1_9TELE
MRLAPQPSAQPLRLIVVLLLTTGVVTSPVLSSGCPDRCVCDDQLVVQCAGQHLTTFPVNLPLATRQLIISNNRIVELPPLALNYLSDLVYLDCSNNSLTEISESTFGNLRKLAYLDLSFNTLTRIEDRTFGPLKSLVMLRMTDNPGLSEIHPDAFAENAALQVLDVSRNNLTALNITSLIALPALRSVGFSGNPWSCECNIEDLCLWVHLEGFKFQGLINYLINFILIPYCCDIITTWGPFSVALSLAAFKRRASSFFTRGVTQNTSHQKKKKKKKLHL